MAVMAIRKRTTALSLVELTTFREARLRPIDAPATNSGTMFDHLVKQRAMTTTRHRPATASASALPLAATAGGRGKRQGRVR